MQQSLSCTLTVNNQGNERKIQVPWSSRLEGQYIVLDRQVGNYTPGLYARQPGGRYQFLINYWELVNNIFQGGADVGVYYMSTTEIAKTENNDAYFGGYKTGTGIPIGSSYHYALITRRTAAGGGGGGNTFPGTKNINFAFKGPMDVQGYLVGSTPVVIPADMAGSRAMVITNQTEGVVQFDLQFLDMFNPVEPIGGPLGTITFDVVTKQTTGSSLGGTFTPGVLIQAYSQTEGIVYAYLNIELE